MEYQTKCYKCGNQVIIRFIGLSKAPDIKVLCHECAGTTKRKQRKPVHKPDLVGETIVAGADIDQEQRHNTPRTRQDCI